MVKVNMDFPCGIAITNAWADSTVLAAIFQVERFAKSRVFLDHYQTVIFGKPP
jgi:hypothetical protein